MRRFLAAIRFLTILPVPGPLGTAEADLAGSVPFFPIVGLLIGAVAAAAAYGLSLCAPPLISAAAIVVLLTGVGGGLHADGLADTADGLLSHRPRERALEIMKDSRTGAMGVLAIVCVLGTKFAALASIAPWNLWAAALLMPLAGRCAMVVHMALLPYVRAEGLATVFYKRRPRYSAVWAVAVLAGASGAMFGLKGLVLAAICLAVTLVLAGWCYRRIGGATGDTFGAACEIVETVPALVVAMWPLQAARW